LHHYVTLFFCLWIAIADSQELPISADFTNAIELTFKNRKVTYGPTLSPKGYGKTNEIKACDKLDAFVFEKEHNSAWYVFCCPEEGDIVFEILPEHTQNDYDFMLYAHQDSAFYPQLLKGNLAPTMSNLARSGKGERAATGLSYLSNESNIPTGKGYSFLKPLHVKKGERYVLVIDNVYPRGKGHTIKLYYLRAIFIGGNVLNENKEALLCDISLQDANGNVIKKIQSDKNGNYSLKTNILESESYSLIYHHDSCFSTCTNITAGFLSKNNYELTHTKTILPKLKKEKKYLLSNVFFHSSGTQLLYSSMPMLNHFAEMLLQNPTIKIQIEGHVNSPNNPINGGKEATLSTNRAKLVYDYLLSKGIDKRRVTYIGYGSLYMIYPKANSAKEFEANDRIEILILEK
jgi:outer membrane protein OmpA-like peptidoglycan-associated protein